MIIGLFFAILKKMPCIPVVYEDSEIYLINKRPGLSVQGGANVTHSVDRDLAAQCGRKVFLVHRLDKETSGLLIVAKSPQAAAKWTRLVGEKSVVKEYRALCVGVPAKKSGRITLPITENGSAKNAATFYELETVIRPLPQSANPLLSLVRCRLESGRRHQIRIHLAKSGFPVAGDDKYGDFKANRLLKKEGIKRLALCAFRLTLPLSGGSRVFEIECDFGLPGLPEHGCPACRNTSNGR